ncbi:uncharacterized protein CDAR_182691 [Caerostris darwini]|uniref:Uncharacterized protein n=1 Tax=Caerostris darwini TaxID=1538125 RepID=A0AAV4SRY5_9ARAC|nr:uncharacterized protein CDAR_182691 [Caerostris darwini]
MKILKTEILILLIIACIVPGKGLKTIITSQNTGSISPGDFIVQILTEPESLIRIFDGFNLSFQMLRHLGRTGPALLRLPFDKNFLSNNYDHMGLDSWRRPYYSRMPTMFAEEAPRYIKTLHGGYQHRTHLKQLLMPIHF